MNEETRIELETIKASAESILKKVNSLLENMGESGALTSEQWWNRRNSVLAAVLSKGGTVSSDEWREIGAKYGFDPRGLGGFYVGKNASMTRIAGDRRALRDSGVQDVKRWIREHPEKAEEFGLDPDNL